MSGIANQSALDEAQSSYEAIFSSFFDNTNEALMHALACEDIAVDGEKLVIPIVTGDPQLREWIGEKHFKALRAYSHEIAVTTYEASIGIKRRQVDNDKSGVVRSRVTPFLSSFRGKLEKLLIDKLLANTWTSYDGVTLLNDSHPHTSSTGDNLTTAAFSKAQHVAVKQAMAGYKDEDGNPLGIKPTHFFCSTANEDAAIHIFNCTERVAAINASGVEATASVVAAASIPNVYKGEVTVVVSKYLSGQQYFYMDLSKPGMRPFIRALSRELEPHVQDQMDNYGRYYHDQYAYSVEGDFGYGPGLWQTIYGRVTSS